MAAKTIRSLFSQFIEFRHNKIATWIKIMRQKYVMIGCILLSAAAASPQQPDENISLGDSIGVEIDQAERERYHLLPDVAGFQSARITRLPGGKYRLSYSFQDAVGLRQKSLPLSAEALELTRRHVELTEEYLHLRRTSAAGDAREAEMLHRLALRYAAQAKYNLSAELLGDLITAYPQTGQELNAEVFQSDALRLWQSKKALFRKGALLDQSGRTNLLIFSGYYGLWLGIAAPVFFKADSPQAFAAGLLLGAPLSMLLTHHASRETSISDGRATMMSLGGHLGTWQGIGWAAVANQDGSDAVGIGALGGLAGIGAATLLTSKTDFSTGHAGLTSSGLQWGAWFGLVVAMMADHNENDLLRDMLIGSDALIIAVLLTTKDVQMSNARVRIINLAGVIGAVLGFGIDLLIEVDEPSTAFAIAGLGSVGGLIAGKEMTRNFDRGKELTLFDLSASRLCHSFSRGQILDSIAPRLSLQQLSDKKRFVPAIGVQLSFN